MFNINNNFKSSNAYIKNILVLISGSGLSQLIALAFVPVLTRLYSPDNFGLYGVILSTSAVLSVFSTLRLERALVISKSPKETESLLIITAILSVVFGIIVYLIFKLISMNENNSSFSIITIINNDFSSIMAVLICLLGFETILKNYSLKKAQYTSIAYSKAVHSSAQGSSQLTLNYFGISNGLALGAITSLAIRSLWLLYKNIKDFVNAAKNFNKGRLIVTFRRNKKFINYMLFASFFAAILNQSLIFLSSVLISISVSGKLFMAHRLLVVPISLFTRALTDVNFQEFSEGQIHEIKNLYIQRLNMLFKYGFFPFFLAALVSPFLLPIILGEAWEDTGLYASCLLPGLFVQFVIAPFGTILWVVKRNKEFLYLTLLRLLVLLSFMYLGNVLSYGFGLAIGYSVGLIFGYVFQHILILRVLRSN